MANNKFKELGEEFQTCLEESKELFDGALVPSNLSNMDDRELTNAMKGYRLMNRMLDLCGAMFVEQMALMDKIDKVADKYLKG